MEPKTVKERIQFYKDQGLSVGELFHDPDFSGLSPDEVIELHDHLCDLAGTKEITNPVIVAAIEAAERGEGRENRIIFHSLYLHRVKRLS